MTRITSIEACHYRIPLPVVMSDSTHGDMTHSGLIVARIRDSEGADGIGYTYTVNDVGSRALPVTSHGIHDIHVHLLGAIPNGSWLEFHGFGLEHFLAEPLRLEDGHAVAPDRPGHGIELDFDALAAHRVRART